MRKIGIAFTSLWIATGMLLTPVVQGQTMDDPAELIERGDQLFNAGYVREACQLFQKSYDLEPKGGLLFALAKCREREGKLATALTLYRDYLHAVDWMKEQLQKKHASQAQDARKAAQNLEVQVPRLKLVWHGDVPKDARVMVDGVDVLSHVNKERALDPGKYYVVVECCGYRAELPMLTLERGRPTLEVDLNPARWSSESYTVTPLTTTTFAASPSSRVPGVGKFYADVGGGVIVLSAEAYWGAFMGKIGYERKGEWGAVKAGLGLELTYVQSLAGSKEGLSRIYAPGIAARPVLQYRRVEFRPALGYTAMLAKRPEPNGEIHVNHYFAWGVGMKFKLTNHLDALVDFNFYNVDIWNGFVGVGAYF